MSNVEEIERTAEQLPLAELNKLAAWIDRRRSQIESAHPSSGNGDSASGTNDDRPIWEVIAEIGASIPDEEWKKVPTDLARNYKHYLYGAPKSG